MVRGLASRLLASALLAASSMAATMLPPAATQGDDQILLAVRLRHQLIPDVIPAMARGQDVLLPLGELCRVLELAIDVDPAAGMAHGFVIVERRNFDLDVARATAAAGGKPAAFAPSRVQVQDDDIYVARDLLEEWLPLHLEVDVHAAMVAIAPTELLPVERRRAREQRGADVRNASLGGQPSYPKVAAPRTFWSWPATDLSVGLTTTPRSDGQGGLREEFSALMAGDLLYMDSTLFLSGTGGDPLAQVRASLSRTDPEGNLLGFMRARQVVLGETLFPGLDLVAPAASGPGITLSNRPVGRPTQFDRHTFSGPLPPGWDVELYRDGELLGYQQSRGDGAYEFADVPVLFGLNLFDLVFYGPRGERREERVALNVADAQTPKGKLYYHVGAIDPRDARPRAMADVDFGLTSHVALSGALSSVDREDGTHDYAQAALTSSWSRIASSFDVAADGRGGSAAQALVQTRLGDVFFTASHAILRDFVSDQFVPLYGTIASRSRLYVHGAAPMPWIRLLPVSLEVQRDALTDGTFVDSVTARIAASRRGFAASNEIQVQRASRDASLDQTTGLFMLSRYGQRLSVRAEVEYELAPRGDLRSVALLASPRWSDDYVLDLGVRRLAQSDENHLLASITKLQGSFGLGASLDYSPEAGLSASLTFSVGLAREPRSGSWDTDARPIASMGAVSLRAFLDGNGNGILDQGEQLLEGVGFTCNGVPQATRTDSKGCVVLYQLPSFTSVGVAVMTSTLEDPMWIPEGEGLAVVPRPGSVIPIDVPIVPTGEITGTVFVEQLGKSRQAAGVALALVDAHGRTVREGRSAYDGFYDLAHVPPGTYTIKVDDSHAARLGALPVARDIQIRPPDADLDGIDLVLHSQRTDRGRAR
ncbi:MAG: carboxypeptidase-like regulatory domain-containing protein [Acidobacteriota bacterium]